MKEKLENGLFIFRRDLRIVDNNGLHFLSELCKNIYTIFIFTPEQVGNNNKYKSDNAVQFMIESLENLSTSIKGYGGHLYTFYGHNEKIITDCIKAWDINIIGFNLDITPYARNRDDKIIKMCQKMNIFVAHSYDYYLSQPGTVVNGTGEPYQKFTPYYEKARKLKVEKPRGKMKLPFTKNDKHISNKISLEQAMHKFTKINNNKLVKGGRYEALKLLSKAMRTLKNYNAIHNDLNKQTSELSASIKFGCLSIREVYHSLHSKVGLIRQLYWRDFYANILYEFPRVIGHSLKPKYDKIHWHYNANWFKAWCNGVTGYPVVDAGMREMNTTGYMHNRARLIVASFLVKILLIDWREGEEYFSNKLTDYDVANNNGNWGWISSGGADSQPFFRIFNPSIQGENFDKDCEYIKKWIPELSSLEPKIIHKWETEWVNHKDIKYPKPICNYSEQREKALKMYKDALY
jgi:deoxyribodipyrimidine photo-lyase